MNSLNLMLYEFDEFRVDPARRLLSRNGDLISLTPKVFELLLVFIENPGAILEKVRLMELLWSDSFVEESNIVQNVAVLRRALGETSKENRFIVTVPGRGYRFVAEVRSTNRSSVEKPGRSTNQTSRLPMPSGKVLTLVRPAGTGTAVALAAEKETEPALPTSVNSNIQEKAPPAIIPSAADATRSNRISLYSAAVVFGLLSIGALATYLVTIYTRPTGGAGSSISKIAVLPPRPIDRLSQERGMEFAIAHSLILKLSESNDFNVSQLSAVRKFVELDEDPLKIGNDLGVDFVLASDYQFSDGRIRVASQLLNISTGKIEQTFKTETATTEGFAMQDAVSNAIGNAVLARFGRPATRFAASRGTQSEQAHNLFYEALYLVEKGSRDDSAKAAELLGQAVLLDPVYAQAWALRAQAYCQFAHFGGGVPNEIFTIAEPMLDKALALDGENPTALMVRGTINRDYHWRFDEAYRDLQHSIEIDPHNCQTHRVLAGLYYRDGRFAE